MASNQPGAAGSNLTECLSEFVWRTQYDDLPGDVIRFSKQIMLDTLGVAWAGAGAEGCNAGCKTVCAQAGSAESSVWVHGDRLPAASAAFANSLFAAALDYDSFHQAGTLHSDIVVLPAGLAIAEREGTSGKAFIAAMTAANEIVCRLGLSTQQRTGWFFTSVHGVFGAAAVTARLLGGNARVIRHAMGLAYLNAAGTQQPAVERSMSKRVEGAFAVWSGVHAGQLAAAGIEGPSDAIDGRFGLYAMYEPGDINALTNELGERYEFLQTTIKRYPSCACSHGATDAALLLASKNDVAPDQVARVGVTLSPYMARLVGAPFNPEGQLEVAAQFSVQYAIATALHRRRFGLDDLTPEAVKDHAVGRLARLVHVRVDESNSGVMVPVTVTITTRDGRRLAHTVSALPGTPEQPLSKAQLLEKFQACVTAGPHPLTASKAEALAERVLNIEDVANMRSFFDGIFEV